VTMDAQLKAKWVEALRSGKFAQTQLELHNGSGHCCLGVLCRVAQIDIGDTEGAYRKVEEIVGNYGPFVKLNDTDEKSFPEIADYIEANL